MCSVDSTEQTKEDLLKLVEDLRQQVSPQSLCDPCGLERDANFTHQWRVMLSGTILKDVKDCNDEIRGIVTCISGIRLPLGAKESITVGCGVSRVLRSDWNGLRCCKWRAMDSLGTTL
jgi:hypothetical protein